MIKTLMIVFVLITVAFLVFAGIWWVAMDEYKEIIKISDFTKALVGIIQSFFIAMPIVFSLSGLVVFLMSFEYRDSDQNEFRQD